MLITVVAKQPLNPCTKVVHMTSNCAFVKKIFPHLFSCVFYIFCYFKCALISMCHVIFECFIYFSLINLWKAGGVPIPSMSSAVPAQSQSGSRTEDRYAALAELDNELSTTVSTGSNVQG